MESPSPSVPLEIKEKAALVFDDISEESSEPISKPTAIPNKLEETKKLHVNDKNNNVHINKGGDQGDSLQTTLKLSEPSPQPDNDNQPYIPTFMTELKDKKRNSIISQKPRSDSPSLVDFSSDFKPSNQQKAKAGRRGDKPSGTSHFSVVDADRAEGNQSPVLANFSFDTTSHKTLANVHSKDHRRVSVNRGERSVQHDPFRIDDNSSPPLVIMKS